MAFPFGVRVITDRNGQLLKLIGMSIREIEGCICYLGQSLPFTIKGNEQLEYADGGFSSISDIGVVLLEYR